MTARIALVANTSWYLHNFRTNLMLALREQGYHIVAIAPEDEYSERLSSQGFSHRHISLKSSGRNPIAETRTIIQLRRVLRKENVDTILSFTPKGNLYAALAATKLPVALFPNISGLGRAFNGSPGLKFVATTLYKTTLKRARRVLFQNDDDRRFFIHAGLVASDKSERIPGSGVDLLRFAPVTKPDHKTGNLVFLLSARLLWEKGIREYVEAAREIRSANGNVRFQILGALASENSSAVPEKTLYRWVQEGIVEYLGSTDDVRPYLASTDCVVLPSFYREGVPRSLLEAAAMGLPIITTDMPGCRDAVDDGVTGYICCPRNVDDLVAKLRNFMEIDPAQRKQFGSEGRKKMEREFDERIIIARYLDLISQPSPPAARANNENAAT